MANARSIWDRPAPSPGAGEELDERLIAAEYRGGFPLVYRPGVRRGVIRVEE